MLEVHRSLRTLHLLRAQSPVWPPAASLFPPAAPRLASPRLFSFSLSASQFSPALRALRLFRQRRVPNKVFGSLAPAICTSTGGVTLLSPSHTFRSSATFVVGSSAAVLRSALCVRSPGLASAIPPLRPLSLSLPLSFHSRVPYAHTHTHFSSPLP